MLYYWLSALGSRFGHLNVFHYITLRAALAGTTAFALCLWMSPWMIRRLRAWGFVQQVRQRDECPALEGFHAEKSGTPTMGGLLLVLSIVGTAVLWADLSNPYVLLVIGVTTAFGTIGVFDDYLKLIRRKSCGLTCRAKLTGQAVVGLAAGWWLFGDAGIGAWLEVPFAKSAVVTLGALYIPFVVLVLAAASNAVNLTDGLDGLASGLMIMVALAYAIFAYVTGHVAFADYLGVYFNPQAGELTILCAAIVGACLGFLWFNAYPASVFMGDTGALALGGAIGMIALCVKKELLLVIAGGIFVVEAASVILQVGSYRLRGRRRLFLLAPIHHHFQMQGWPETKVTVRFWIIGALLALVSLSTLKLR